MKPKQIVLKEKKENEIKNNFFLSCFVSGAFFADLGDGENYLFIAEFLSHFLIYHSGMNYFYQIQIPN